jgi:hypothetical protein
MSEEVEERSEADDDDEAIVPEVKLKEALAWIATRNTAFVQIIAQPFSTHLESPANLESAASATGIDLSFAESTIEAWHLLRSAISAGKISATGILESLPEDYLPGEPLRTRGRRLELLAETARHLDLVVGRKFTLRPRKLEASPKWWFEIQVRLDQLQEYFPDNEKKRKRIATKLEYVVSWLRENFDDYPSGHGLKDLARMITETGGPLGDPIFSVNEKTVGRALRKIWPHGNSKTS